MSAPDLQAASSRSWEELVRDGAAGVDAPAATRRLELVSFGLGRDSYAVSVGQVREIVRLRPVTPMPRVPDAVRGVISLRGEIVQVIDLRLRLDLEAKEPERSTRIIVVHGENGKAAGILVDSVREVSRVSESAIRPSPGSEPGSVEALCVRGDEFVSLVDLDRVLEIHAER